MNTHLSPGRFGQYQTIRRLAVGGMAEIFLAHPSGQPGKLLVLKCILPHLAERQEFQDMFLDEVRIAVRLKHPAVARVYEYGYAQGTWFMVMEYIDGCDLRIVFKVFEKLKRRISWPQAVALGLQASEALHYVHGCRDDQGRSLQVVHRDVSPHNMMLTRAGRLKLMDFGIAKARNRLTRTSTGLIKGKMRYLSPEQLRAAALDGRSDQYALAVVLWELLAGRHLLQGTSDMGRHEQILSAARSRLREYCPECPEALDVLLSRAMSMAPEDRYPDMAAFGAALGKCTSILDNPESELQSLVAQVCPHSSETVDAPRKTKIVSLGIASSPSVTVSAATWSAVVTDMFAQLSIPLRKLRLRLWLMSAVLLSAVALFVLTTRMSGTQPIVSVPISPVPNEIRQVPFVPPPPAEVVVPQSKQNTGISSRIRKRHRSAKVKYGTLMLRVMDSWADVYEGERHLGQTPFGALRLTAGRHRLHCRNRELGLQRDIVVEIEPEKVTRFVLNWE